MIQACCSLMKVNRKKHAVNKLNCICICVKCIPNTKPVVCTYIANSHSQPDVLGGWNTDLSNLQNYPNNFG